ncbi:MAG: DUF2325 domain-containing protein [Dehalococcoidia bacterium]
MATLRADENRYLLLALPHERANLARIPGARPLPGGRSVQLPRQAAVILALDRVFGPGTWTVDPDLAHEVAEARTRRYAPAEDEARIHLEAGSLAVECTIADKELVKQVPGYRWSPAQRRWYLAAMPLALDVLRDAFGDRLSVDREVEDLIALRRVDEAREADRASRVPEATPPRSPAPAPVEAAMPPVNTVAAAPESFRDLRQLPLSDGLGPVLERLIEAVEGLTSRLDALSPVLTATSAAPATPTTPAVDPDPEGDESDWREILARSNHDPTDALESARRRMQTAIDPSPELRAVAGIAAWRAGETNDAFKTLKKALEGGASLEDGDLTTLARNAYVEVVLLLISADCAPAESVSSVDKLRELLLRELSNDGGFDDEAVGGATARETLDLLVNDRALRSISPILGDYCRILHLLSTARGGTRMASERVADLLQDQSLGADAFALGCVLLACVLQEAPCVDEWMMRWPGLEEEAPISDGGWLADLAERRLGAATGVIAGEAALAVLACIAAGPADQASLARRRNLVAFIPPGHHGRRYAEFLAMYRLAAAGSRLPLDSFPGYASFLATVPLLRSASYLTEVYLNGENQSGSAVRAVADGVYLPALEAGGLTDPGEQLFPLLDLLAAGTKPDHLLNELARLIEEEAVPGGGMLSREDRIRVYRAAYAKCIELGHDRDSRDAFFRLARALEVEPEPEPLIDLCNEASRSIKAVRLPAALTLLEVILGEGLPFEETLAQVLELMPAKGKDAFLDPQIQGLQLAYEPLRDAIASRFATSTETAEVSEPRMLEGRRILVVGGHQRMKARATPVLEAAGLKVDWLDSTEGKAGGQLIDLVKGACELVVINTAYIGHSQSGRAEQEARRAGKTVISQGYNGLGSFLSAIRSGLEPQGEKSAKASRVSELRKISRR